MNPSNTMKVWNLLGWLTEPGIDAIYPTKWNQSTNTIYFTSGVSFCLGFLGVSVFLQCCQLTEPTVNQPASTIFVQNSAATHRALTAVCG